MTSYSGPVELLTQDGNHVASATCQYTVRRNRMGMRSWNGRLSNLDTDMPPDLPGPCVLRLPTGEEGDIVFANVRHAVRGRRYLGYTIDFEGTGPSPRHVDKGNHLN